MAILHRLLLNSPAMCVTNFSCSSLHITFVQFSNEDGSMHEESTRVEMERVLYAQMLILFAPHAVPAVAHLPLLLTTLKSKQPRLRKTAADTLRHLSGMKHSSYMNLSS